MSHCGAYLRAKGHHSIIGRDDRGSVDRGQAGDSIHRRAAAPFASATALSSGTPPRIRLGSSANGGSTG